MKPNIDQNESKMTSVRRNKVKYSHVVKKKKQNNQMCVEKLNFCWALEIVKIIMASKTYKPYLTSKNIYHLSIFIWKKFVSL